MAPRRRRPRSVPILLGFVLCVAAVNGRALEINGQGSSPDPTTSPPSTVSPILAPAPAHGSMPTPSTSKPAILPVNDPTLPNSTASAIPQSGGNPGQTSQRPTNSESPPPPVAQLTPSPTPKPTRRPSMPIPVTFDPESPSPPTVTPEPTSPLRLPLTVTPIPTTAPPSTATTSIAPTTPAASNAASPTEPTDALATPIPTATAASPMPSPYRRGDDVIVVPTNDSSITGVEVVVAPSQSPALVVRDGESILPYKVSPLSADDKRVFAFIAYLSSILALSSLVMAIVFHFLALQSTFTSSAGRMSTIASPNQWELLPFITYVQAMASMAHYVVRLAPQYLKQYVDTFSWTVFIPLHSSGSGISDLSLGLSQSLNGRRRRLDPIVVVLDGLVAFADRIGVQETQLLQTTVGGVLVVGGVLLVAAGLVFWCAPVRGQQKPSVVEEEEADTVEATEDTVRVEDGNQIQRPAMLIVYGVVVIALALVLYPLTLVVTFEMASQVRAGQASGSALAIAVLVVVFVCVPFIAKSIITVRAANSEDQYNKSTAFRTVWGSLCSPSDVRLDRRVFFVCAWLSMQVLSAVVVGSVWSETWQLVLLLSVDLVFLGVLLCRSGPYEHRLPFLVMAIVIMLKVFNTSLAFAFVSSSNTGVSTRRSAATAFIIVNSLVVILWFVRHFGMACRMLRVTWDHRRSARRRTPLEATPVVDGNAFDALQSTKNEQLSAHY